MSAAFEKLARSTDAELEALLLGASAPDPESLAGFEWRGYNTAAFTALLGIRKFIKGFFVGPSGVEGYNVPARQNALGEEWVAQPRPDNPKRFGFYTVYRVRPESTDNRYPNSLLLDYGASPRNFTLAPERLLRDYLAQPFPGDPDLLLGKAYLAFGPARVYANFFILGRLRATNWKL